jgi:hypothetical protein
MFELTKEKTEIRKAAREFAEGEFADVARKLDEKGCFDGWKAFVQNVRSFLIRSHQRQPFARMRQFKSHKNRIRLTWKSRNQKKVRHETCFFKDTF